MVNSNDNTSKGTLEESRIQTSKPFGKTKVFSAVLALMVKKKNFFKSTKYYFYTVISIAFYMELFI